MLNENYKRVISKGNLYSQIGRKFSTKLKTKKKKIIKKNDFNVSCFFKF